MVSVRGFQFFCDLSQLTLVARSDDQVKTRRHQLRQVEPNAAGRAGDQGSLALVVRAEGANICGKNHDFLQRNQSYVNAKLHTPRYAKMRHLAHS